MRRTFRRRGHLEPGAGFGLRFQDPLQFRRTAQVVHITNPTGNFLLAEQLLAAANATPQGRARLALANLFGDLPGWFNPASPEPAANDFASQAANQFLWAQQVDFPFIFAFRAELEFRAGGNP